MTGTNGNPTDTTGPTDHTGVIVVGSGPTGLLLAGDLATAGIPVTVLEKRPRKISNLSRAFALHARSLEQLDARGLADELEATGRTLDRLRLFGRLSIDLTALPSRFNHVLVLPQYEVEKALARRAVEAGAGFRYDTEMTGLVQDADGVTVGTRGADGRTESLRAAYVVGADGMRSAVRGAIGLPFPGKSVIRSVVLACEARRAAGRAAHGQRGGRRVRVPRAVRGRVLPGDRLAPRPRCARHRAAGPGRGQGDHPARARP
ncbi:hypothetical protein GTY41_14885 [Streptomyces sp. SID685]|nr:hypothetical protein [Streptomyces sp. SID685]